MSAKRLEGETWEDYKARRAEGNKLVKAHLRGRKIKITRKEIKARMGETTHPLPLPGGE